MMRKLSGIAYLLALSLLIWSGFYFASSEGFVAAGKPPLFLCRQLLSSGGDDETVTVVLALYAIPLAIRIFCYQRKISNLETSIFLLVTFLCFVFVTMAPECGSLIATLFQRQNPALWAMTILWALSGVLFFLRRRQN